MNKALILALFALFCASFFVTCEESKEEPCNSTLLGSPCYIPPLCSNFTAGAVPCENCDPTNPAHAACYSCDNTHPDSLPCNDCSALNPMHLACQAPPGCSNDTGALPCMSCDTANPDHICYYCNNMTAEGPPCSDCNPDFHPACLNCDNFVVEGPACLTCDSTDSTHLACYCHDSLPNAPFDSLLNAPRYCAGCDYANKKYHCYCKNTSRLGPPCVDCAAKGLGCTDCDTTNPLHVACFCSNTDFSAPRICDNCDPTNPAHKACYVPPQFRCFDPEDGADIPTKLSVSGLYKGKTIDPRAIAYDVNISQWADSVSRDRYVLLCNEGAQITFMDTSDYYGYPDGVAFIQQLYMGTTFLETRLLLKKNGTDEWFPFNYRWYEDQSDAYLLGGSDNTEDAYLDPDSTKKWRFDNMYGCVQCHTGRYVQGFFTAQLNRPSLQEPGINQITYFFNTGLFAGVQPANLDALPRWSWNPAVTDSTEREQMVYSYLAAQCSPCHGEKGYVEGQDQNLDYHAMHTNEPVLIDRYTTVSIPSCYNGRIIFRGDPGASTLYFRQTERPSTGFFPLGTQMPPAAYYERDTTALRIMYDWICSLDAEWCAAAPGSTDDVITVDTVYAADSVTIDTIMVDTITIEKCPEITW